MISKINVVPIIKDHLKTLKDSKSTRVLKRDIIGFYGLPFCLSFILMYKNVILPEKYINIGIIAHTIAIPLLVNVLFLIYNIMERNRLNKIESKVLKQLYQNLAYTILISFFSLFLLAAFNVGFLPAFVWGDLCFGRVIWVWRSLV